MDPFDHHGRLTSFYVDYPRGQRVRATTSGAKASFLAFLRGVGGRSGSPG